MRPTVSGALPDAARIADYIIFHLLHFIHMFRGAHCTGTAIQLYGQVTGMVDPSTVHPIMSAKLQWRWDGLEDGHTVVWYMASYSI